MTRVEEALATFKEGYNCSQAVLSAYAKDYELSDLKAKKIASGLGGGIGRMGETCGAVTGAIMVIGLESAMSSKDPLQANETTYQMVGEFLRQFKVRHKSALCRDLLGYDISNRQTLLEVRKLGIFRSVCPAYIKDAVEILEALIGQQA